MSNNIFNEDFRDCIKALNENNVEYLLVGGYAVILHGYRRTTGDLDIWVNTTPKNLIQLRKAFLQFGLPATELTEYNFLQNEAIDVFSFGRPPVGIDIMKKVKGCDFATAYNLSKEYIENGLPIRFIHLNTLLEAKKASGRFKDLDDIEKLSG
ncbi:MAG: hypothetical protein IPJ81_08860 [Chitinophagaceae bacterium]|jgi:hypothetical protein|nr:hypothetical protein [Chitinophagaceae bacterium]